MNETAFPLDQPNAKIRAGEELNIAALEPHLKTQLGPSSHNLEISQFAAGYSNLTYLVRWGEREFVLRRPPIGNQVKSAHDMSREFHVLSHLSAHYDVAPKPVLFCDDESILGAPFYMMERIKGVILRKVAPDDTRLDAKTLKALCGSFANQLAKLHAIDFAQIGLSDLGRPEGYVERQISGWTRRFGNAATETVDEIEALAKWLPNNQPTNSRAALIHNDFKFDNLLLAPTDLTQIIAVLDWEMTTLGDPLMDLGSTLAYWVEADDDPSFRVWSFGPTDRVGAYSRRELADAYLSSPAFSESNVRADASDAELLFYYSYGLFKLAVIVQQIFARYERGQTKDRRFANLDKMVLAIGQQAWRAIERKAI